MSRASALARGRAFAAAGFVDACTIQRQTGTTTDDLTGAVTPTYGTPAVYVGPARIQINQTSPSGGRMDSGEASIVLFGVTLQLPVDTSVGIQRGDLVTMTAAAHDADQVGRTYHVETLGTKSEATTRRLGLIETT
jgi:hypothetical protein